MALQSVLKKYSDPYGYFGENWSNYPPRVDGAMAQIWNRSGAKLPFGRFVRKDTADGVALPSATGQAMLGVTLFNGTECYRDQDEPYGYLDDQQVAIMREGHIIVYCEVAVIAYGDPVYVRHTANGGLNVIGGVANAAGTGLDLVPGAKFASSLVNQNRAVIMLNLP